jgi:hypothetical protein
MREQRQKNKDLKSDAYIFKNVFGKIKTQMMK